MDAMPLEEMEEESGEFAVEIEEAAEDLDNCDAMERIVEFLNECR